MHDLVSSHPPLAPRRYLPGMGHDWLLPLYDPLTRLVGIESARSPSSEPTALARPRHLSRAPAGA